jgi:hypothetical protein
MGGKILAIMAVFKLLSAFKIIDLPAFRKVFFPPNL